MILHQLIRVIYPMKIDDFLKEPAFSKYEREVQQFRDEFISEGCEAFLWTSHADEFEAKEYTVALAQKRGNVKISPHIAKFMDQFSCIDAQYIVFVYPEDYSPKFLMAQEIAKNAKNLM